MSFPITHPHLQFRFWCAAAGSHVSDYSYDGKVDELFQGDGVLVAEQCTGLRDLSGEFAYEGDIVEILVGEDMPPWEGGGMVGAGVVNGMAGDSVFLEVARDPTCPTNLYLSGVGAGGVELFLPVSWVKKGMIRGQRWEKNV